MKLNAKLFVGILSSSLLFVGCSEDTPGPNPNGTVVKDSTTIDRTEKIENIFFNIPSPIETISILKNAGATYEWNLPLDPMQVDEFTSSLEKAIAMGIYGADLNYASVFGIDNDMYMFLSCAEKLGKEIGVGQVFTEEVTHRIEDNVENKDSMQVIISETFWSMDSQLHEEGRESVSALVIAGGWIEGVYLATQLAVLNPDNEEIKSRIAEQKYSVENLVKLLETYDDSSEEFLEITMMFKDLEELFQQIEEEKTTPAESVDEDGMPIIGQQITLTMSNELLKEITQLVSEIRVDFTN
ncbi:hypothetical protein [Parvicella tangerina]|uniref:Lipoprotein n=1 Tax=Parvicella tangerina TaxID=2829795 RepID=A0A916JML5_9FLAO|nr:hypothetical protein [Parvicella tangerina]CAG5081166.1 hypothetical protein CRYO30217_01553 [Parvicella tangerina]